MAPGFADLWSVVLAGGDGTRLLPLTRHIAGHACPKQFCTVTGSQTLLGQTLSRVAPLIPAGRTVVVANEAHVGYLRRTLSEPAPPHVLLQPCNKGTAAGILWPAHWLSVRHPDAIVAVFPSDHFVYPERRFLAHVTRAVRVVRERPDLVVLLGVDPEGPEEGYGWIELGEPLVGAAGCALVRGFWEKPTAGRAQHFFDSGFLWNSLVVVGRVDALKALGRRHVPDVDSRLERLTRCAGAPYESSAIREAYASMRPANFSRDVLERAAESLAVLPVRGVLWSDWGTPERVVDTLRRIGATPSWLEEWSVGQPDAVSAGLPEGRRRAEPTVALASVADRS